MDQVELRYYNPGATMPLVVPVHVVCNVPDELLFSNIHTNSRNGRPWLKLAVGHSKPALICGSGPSLADTLNDIRSKWLAGATVFAMNGAARFLAENGVMPDYQVILDARKRTKEVVGPARAHLFASQVDPILFDMVPTAEIWHMFFEGMEAQLPEYNDDYCMIGGKASVGNASLGLAYAMGYRHLEVYGLDSSHRGAAGHAFFQAINVNDPVTRVEFNGREYIASLTMKLQADTFHLAAEALMREGCSIEVHGSGLLQDMWRERQQPISEREKYERMWRYPEYRIAAPGEATVEEFLARCQPRGRVLDFGTGTGRAALRISQECEVLCLDIADNCRDPAAMGLAFLRCDLSDHIPVFGNFGYCTDVMEHIPPKNVDSVLRNIAQVVSGETFFQISLIDDVMGGLIGHPLHLSVHPFEWWLSKFVDLGFSIRWSENRGSEAVFIVKRSSQNAT